MRSERHPEQHLETGSSERTAVTGYAVVIEHEGDAWGAYVPDLPGCVATGRTREEVERRIREAVPVHVALLRESGQEVPDPISEGIIILVPAS
jgi:predicted RNase H-like HicB family nuclease